MAIVVVDWQWVAAWSWSSHAWLVGWQWDWSLSRAVVRDGLELEQAMIDWQSDGVGYLEAGVGEQS